VTPRHRKPADPHGIIGPLRERIHDLERELDSFKRIAAQEINNLTTANHKLAQALKAMMPESPAETDIITP
jgi:hypothetical protein